jgi:hypothetical protein
MTDEAILMRGGSVPQMYDTEVSGVAVAKTLMVSRPHYLKAKPSVPDNWAFPVIVVIVSLGCLTFGILVERGMKNLIQWVTEKVRQTKERNEFTQIDRS